MQYTLESDFAKHVRSPELHRVYLLYGSQSLLIEQYEKKLVQKALHGTFDDFNLHRFNGDELDLQVGDRFMLGDSAVLEVTQIGKPDHPSVVTRTFGISLLPYEGRFCRVIKGGVVKKGDEVKKLQ